MIVGRPAAQVGRDGVDHLTYEAYEDKVLQRFAEICAETRRRWPDTGRIVMWHRTGRLVVGESSVVTVVSAPHRAEAFEAGRFTIDALKESAPIWKHEVWADGADWGTGASDITSDVAGVHGQRVGGLFLRHRIFFPHDAITRPSRKATSAVRPSASLDRQALVHWHCLD